MGRLYVRTPKKQRPVQSPLSGIEAERRRVRDRPSPGKPRRAFTWRSSCSGSTRRIARSYWRSIYEMQSVRGNDLWL